LDNRKKEQLLTKVEKTVEATGNAKDLVTSVIEDILAPTNLEQVLDPEKIKEIQISKIPIIKKIN